MLTLEFSSAIPGTILDKDGKGTGFTTVQGNKAGDQKVPRLIDLKTGSLALTATQGTSVGSTNTLKNALQVGLNPTQTFTVSTRVKDPLLDLTTASQSGIFFGTDDDNYVKLVVGKANNGLKIQLFKEVNGASSSVDIATVQDVPNIRTLDLYLAGDAERKTFSAAYRVNSDTGARRTLDQNFRLPQNQAARFFGDATKARAGILAFTDQGPDVPVTFYSFGIAQNVKINFQPSGAFLPAGYLKDSGQAYNDARGYGWINQRTRAALDISAYARDRNRPGADQRIDTLLHMQYAGIPDAAWEYALPNGTYNVTVSVGDQANASGDYDSQHTIRVEGDTIINQFEGSKAQKYQLNSGTVKVTDGKLTIDAVGGFNTKINYLEIVPITPGNHPSIPDSFPSYSAMGVKRDAVIALDVSLPNKDDGVDPTTLNSNTVQVYQTFNKEPVDGEFNSTGGGDAIVFESKGLLKPDTNYTIRVTEGVRDESGATFLPFSSTFTTGTETKLKPTPGVTFKQETVYNGAPISSLVISPDGTKLYGAALDGVLRRWTINQNGTLSAKPQEFRNPKLAGRAIIGITFDPTNPNVLWISHNDPISEQPAENFTGKISKVTLGSGTSFNDATIQDYVTGLPRSTKDHLTESIAFGPDGKLYVSQGSNSAMGALDPTWNLAESLLSAAILQIDPRRQKPGGFNVQTEGLGAKNYNPDALDAPVKIFATGIRNAYDLLWHTNGNLYAPTNGSAAGGNTPDDPDLRGEQGLKNVATQNDYLFKIVKEGYYGHPNPKRGEYIMNGGNPSLDPKTKDPAEVVREITSTGTVYEGYPVGTQPDPNYRGFAYEFGRNRSPNGIIQYKNQRFNGALKNQLLVTEYSGGDDILALKLDGSGNVIPGSVTKVFSDLNNPLDLIENTKNGNLYVAELQSNDNGTFLGSISLLS